MIPTFDLTYSLADQNFRRTKSIGILNFSVEFLNHLVCRPELRRLIVLSNSALQQRIEIPPNARYWHRIHDGAVAGRLGRIWWDQVGVYGAARRSGNEWLMLPKGFASFLRNCPVRLCAYLADVMPEYYYRTNPRAFSRLETRYFISSMRATVKQAEVIFTNSEFSRREIARVARQRGWPEPRVRTMGIGFERPPVPPRKDEVILVLAGRFPHKRTAMAIAFLAQWQKATDFPGEVHWVGHLPPSAKLPPFPRWRHDVRLAEVDYRNLLHRSRVLVFTSEYEGFGMPPVEAVLARVCPVFSSIAVTLEVMGETGCPFINDSYESFAAALERALRASGQTLDAWADQLLRRHNWDRVTEVFVSELLSLGCGLPRPTLNGDQTRAPRNSAS